MSEWISVEGRLPESDDEFLVVAYGEVRTCMFNPWLSDPSKNREHSYQWFEELDIPNFGSERYNVGGVTHWMPLPEPPKQ